MSIKKMKSTLRCYICMIIFIGGGMTLMVFGGKASKSINPDSKPVVTIEHPVQAEMIISKCKPISFEFKLLIY